MEIEIQDPEQLISDGNAFTENADDFKALVNNIYSIVDDLKGSWTGASAKRYTDNIETYKNDLETLAGTLRNCGALLSAVGKDYSALEEEM